MVFILKTLYTLKKTNKQVKLRSIIRHFSYKCPVFYPVLYPYFAPIAIRLLTIKMADICNYLEVINNIWWSKAPF